MTITRQLGSRLLSFILCFQLCASCTGGGGGASSVINSNGSSGPGSNNTQSQPSTLEISGSIVRALHGVSELIVPSAAAAEGKIVLYDYSNPGSPVEIESQEITGTDAFTLKVESEKVADRVLHLSFTSTEGDDKSREMLLGPAISDEVITAQLDKTATMKAQILKQQLRQEYENGSLKAPEEVRARFQEIEVKDDDTDLDVIGDQELLFKVMASNPSEFALLLYYIKVARESGDLQALRDLKLKISYYLLDLGLVDSKPVFKCSDTEVFFAFKRGQRYNIKAVDSDPSFLKRFGPAVDLGAIETPEQVRDVLNKMTDVLKVLTEDQDISSAVISFAPEDAQLASYSCRMFSRPVKPDEKEQILAWRAAQEFDREIITSVTSDGVSSIYELKKKVETAYLKTIDDFKLRLEKIVSGDQISMIIEQNLPAIKELYLAHFLKLRAEFLAPDLSYLLEVDLKSAPDREAAQKSLEGALGKVLDVYKEKLYKAYNGDDAQISQSWVEQVPGIKKVFESRINELNEAFPQ